jgi:hypothetical protein
MRLPSNDQLYLADFDVAAIHNDRIVAENMFETLVMVEKYKLDDQ